MKVEKISLKVHSWNNCIKLKIGRIENKNARREKSQTVDFDYYIWLKMSPKKEENKILIDYIKHSVGVIWKAAVFDAIRFTALKITYFFIFLRTHINSIGLGDTTHYWSISKFSFTIIK